MLGLAQGARGGATIEEGVEVTGFELDGSGAVTRVDERRPDRRGARVVAVGPWVAGLWEMLELPRRLDVAGTERRCGPTGTSRRARSTSTPMFVTADGSLPPVLHVDSSVPPRRRQGRLVTGEQWGVYFKQDKHSVQGGASRRCRVTSSRSTPIPPGASSPAFRIWCAALSHCMERFEGKRPLYGQVLGWEGRVHGRQLPCLRSDAPERVRGPPTPTTATR